MLIINNNYRAALINDVLMAGSQEEVRLLIDTTIAFLEINKINGYIIGQFIHDSTVDLEKFNPETRTSQQWSNIKMAMIHLRKVMLKFEIETYYKN